MHVVGDDGVLADANCREIAEDKIRVGVARLEMLVGFAQVFAAPSLVLGSCLQILMCSNVRYIR